MNLERKQKSLFLYNSNDKLIEFAITKVMVEKLINKYGHIIVDRLKDENHMLKVNLKCTDV